MANILEEFHDTYVPSMALEGCITLPDGSTRTFDNSQFHNVLLGSDQLTVARARGAANLRSSHARSVHRLDGIVPVVEDWHARMTLMKVNPLQMSHLSEIPILSLPAGIVEKIVLQGISVREGNFILNT